ncbi:Na(+)/H(+) antiporter subunit A [Corynebacterium faecale]|uniref:DUF4040 family protein n=1 Tax=Corynebacterium faecale TaxID=1758466 RepID=UPI0025B59585|nr:DUF4040 family protein [Corynebacterium faecale]WJY91085.1 Na(+)/H(+) antiporter subunit A [Corynebacterium faecale]
MLSSSLILALLGCVLAVPLRRWVGRNSGWILAIPLVLAAALILQALPGNTAADSLSIQESVPWMPTLGVSFSFHLDGLSLVFSMLVLLIGAAVLIYSTRYLGKSDPGHFYLLMSLFAAAMLLLVLTDDLVVFFFAWEITTLCSYLLIARSGPGGRDPAIRTLLVTVAGGLSLLTAFAILMAHTGTTRISEILGDTSWTQDTGFTVAIAFLLAGAVFTKSAQFPFQAWLPDSMVAIAPVSAYLHAAAMVKAGIYLALRFSPAMSDVATWQILLITCGLITALFGAFTAIRRNDLKELLAYSTISQLGLLVTLIGVGTDAALTAAVVHTIAHALFKAALFMTVGIIEHETGIRDRRELAKLNLRLPITTTVVTISALSMAGVPLTFGFISKESLITALVDAPGNTALVVLVTAGVVLTSMMTFAYSLRYILAVWPRRQNSEGDPGMTIGEATPAFYLAPTVLAACTLVFGLLPGLLDTLVTWSANAVTGAPGTVYLSIWHGFNLPLLLSALIIGVGIILVILQKPVSIFLSRFNAPVSGLRVVEQLRDAVITSGGQVSRLAGTSSLPRHLGIPVACLILLALSGGIALTGLPGRMPGDTEPIDWLLVGLMVVGVIGAFRSTTRIGIVVILGVTGYSMALWFFNLGATDVAMTQLLVETLTLLVLVLVLRRLPAKLPREKTGPKVWSAVLAGAAGLATFFAVWAFTGRRDFTETAQWYLNEAAPISGGDNIVNTILVDYRALDTLGELTVLGVAGLSVIVLLQARRPSPILRVPNRGKHPLDDPWANAVFFRAISRIMVPVIILVSMVLLVRGHNEPGGGFIGALVGGAGFALLYLASATDRSRFIRLPYVALIGAGVLVGVATGITGYLEGSFLKPLHFDVFGIHMTTALIFDIGVYLAVIGMILTALNLMGQSTPPLAEEEANPPGPDDSLTPGTTENRTSENREVKA